MRQSRALWVLASAVMVLGIWVGVGKAQQGVAERVGRRLDGVARGLKGGVTEVNEAVRKRFEGVRTEVHRMGAHQRVYARLHWDKTLNGSRIEVHMLRGGAVLLRGTVPDAESKKRAVELAAGTVDVTEVVDELKALAPPVESSVGPSTP
jgi:hyperosmotically inducible protein